MRLAILAIGLLLLGYGAVQTIAFDTDILRWLSPASVTARQMAAEITSKAVPVRMPISVFPAATAEAVAAMSIALGIGWFSMAVATLAGRSVAVVAAPMLAIATAGTVFGGYAILVKFNPTFSTYAFSLTDNSFGNFVNRNNAAMPLNLTIAASIGLLYWQWLIQSNERSSIGSNLRSVLSGPVAAVALVAIATSSIALLVNGSRGGALAAMFAIALVAFESRVGRGGRSFSTAIVAALVVLVTVTAFVFGGETIDRMVALAAGGSPNPSDADAGRVDVSRSPGERFDPSRDGRLIHWRDAAVAAKAYFPMGSGLSSYGDAYTPFRNAPLAAHMQHADNLWIETWVELGWVGSIIVLALIATVIVAVMRLRHSVRSIDGGLRLTIVYTLASIAASQTFDFGLLWPASSWTAAVLIGLAIAAASQTVRIGRRSHRIEPRRIDNIVGSKWMVMATAVIGVMAIAVPLRRIETAAWVETAQFELRQARTRLDIDPTTSIALVRRVTARRGGDDHRVRREASKLLLRAARGMDVRIAPGSDYTAGLSEYNKTAIQRRRLNWVTGASPSLQTIAPESHEIYDEVNQTVDVILQKRPLSIWARRWAVELDFFHRDAARSTAAFDQTTRLQFGNVGRMRQLAEIAAGSGDVDRAAKQYAAVLRLEPSRAAWFASTVRRTPIGDALVWGDLLPDDPASMRQIVSSVVPHLLVHLTAVGSDNVPDATANWSQRAAEVLLTTSPKGSVDDTSQTAANHAANAAKIYRAIGDEPSALAAVNLGLRGHPDDPILRGLRAELMAADPTE